FDLQKKFDSRIRERQVAHFTSSASRRKTLGTGRVPAKVSSPDPQRSLLTGPAGRAMDVSGRGTCKFRPSRQGTIAFATAHTCIPRAILMPAKKLSGPQTYYVGVQSAGRSLPATRQRGFYPAATMR